MLNTWDERNIFFYHLSTLLLIRTKYILETKYVGHEVLYNTSKKHKKIDNQKYTNINLYNPQFISVKVIFFKILMSYFLSKILKMYI